MVLTIGVFASILSRYNQGASMMCWDQSYAATTVGTGPFQPAVRWKGELCIHPDEFKTEDEALVLANELVKAIEDEVEGIIAQRYFIYGEQK